MKEAIKQVINVIMILSASIILGVLSLVVVYSIPINRIQNHVNVSSEIFEREGESPKLWYFYATALDNYTDAIMLLEAAESSHNSVVERAMLNYWTQTITDRKLDNPGPSLINISKKNEIYNTNNGNLAVSKYSRYWHGYLVFLKPILYLIDYGKIRIVNLVMQLLIYAYVVWELLKNEYKYMAVGYVCSMLLLSPVTSGFSLQYSACLYILNMGIIAIIKKYEKDKAQFSCDSCLNLFLILGILTAFFDFLTYPIATFGVPMVLALLFDKAKKNLLKHLFSTFKLGLLWAIGYLGMWGGKWIVATILTNENVLGEAFESVTYRTTGGEGTAIMSVVRNVGAFIINPITIMTISAFIVLIYKEVKMNRYIIKLDSREKILGLVAFIPIVWDALIVNHSYIHFWFTFRSLIISVLSWFAFLEVFVNRKASAKGD